MSRIKLAVVVLAMCLVAACGSGTKSGADGDSKESSPSPSPEFSLASWSQEWAQAKQKYVFALQAFNNQMDMLRGSSATNSQYHAIITRNSRSIADAATALVAAIDAASAIPPARSDLQQAVDDLKAALTNEAKAYGVSAKCKNVDCLSAAAPAVNQAAAQSAKALGAMPSE